MAGRKFNFNANDAEPAKVKTGTKAKTSLKEPKAETDKPKETEQAVEEKEDTITTATGRVGKILEKMDDVVPKAFDARFIPRNKLRFYEDNDYPMEKIEQLAQTILEYGLAHNLEVFYELESDTYVIDAGERRCRAIDLLIERYQNCEDKETKEYQNYIENVKQFEVSGYPCNVRKSKGNGELDLIDLEIRHYVTNEEVRDKDPVKTAKRIQRLNELYTQKNKLLKEKGGEVENVNKKIGKELGISDRQVKKYNALNKLIPELQELFSEKKITLSDGSNYAQLTEEEQRQLLEVIKNGEDKTKIEELYNSITSLKKDMAEKENTIETLESEKAETQKELENAKQELSNLHKKLEEETQKEAPSTEEIEKLKKEIKNADIAIKTYRKNHDTVVKMKDDMIEKLKKELEQKKVTTEIPSGYQESLQLNMKISELEKTMASLKESFDNYKSVYSPEEPVSQSPEDFKKQIKALFKQANDLIK